MFGSDWGKRPEALTAAAFCVITILGAVALMYILGTLNGRESERRQQTPAAYRQSAKAYAQRTCTGLKTSAVFECVYEKVETSQQQANAEQDLSAQQRAAASALASAVISLLTLGISIIGVWYVKRTLDATLKAVEDTSEATNAMREANRIARESNRPWLSVKPQGSALIQFQTGRTPRAAIKLPVNVENFGSSPAVQTYLKFGWKNGAYDSDFEIDKIATSVRGKRTSHDPPVFPGPPALIGQSIWSSEIISDGNMTQAELLKFVEEATLFVVVAYRSPDDSFFYTGDAFFLKGNGNLGTQFSFKLTRRIGNSKMT